MQSGENAGVEEVTRKGELSTLEVAVWRRRAILNSAPTELSCNEEGPATAGARHELRLVPCCANSLRRPLPHTSADGGTEAVGEAPVQSGMCHSLRTTYYHDGDHRRGNSALSAPSVPRF